MKVLDLFSGIGGFSLGLERAGMETVAFCEIEDYPVSILNKHWPDINVHRDIRKLDGKEYRNSVDVVCGGFPCQDLSVAGKQKGITGDRSGLYDAIIRIARVCKPRFIVLENVANLLARPDWFGYELGRLAKIGYDAEWEIIRASDVGAPHKRARVWIVAYPTSKFRNVIEDNPRELSQSKKAPEPRNGSGSQNVADSDSERLKKCDTSSQPDRPGQFTWGIAEGWGKSWWEIEPNVGRVADGVPRRVDRLRGLGNAVVPQVAELVGRMIMDTQG